MDEYTGKRAVGVVAVSRRGSRLPFRDTSRNDDISVQCCNRLGCSTRLKSMDDVGTSRKTKYSKNSSHSASGKGVVGSSSKTCAGSDDRKSCQEPQKLFFDEEKAPAETSNAQGKTEIPELIPLQVAAEIVLPENEDSETGVIGGLSGDTSEKVGSYNSGLNTRPRRQMSQKSGIRNPVVPGSSVQRSFASRSANQLVKPASHGQDGNSSRYGLRNLRCTSISDVLPSGFSSSNSSGGQRNNIVKKRNPDGESSSKVKDLSKLSPGGNSRTSSISISNPTIPISQRFSSQHASRRARHQPCRDGATSVRTRRTINMDSRARLSDHVNGNGLTLSEPCVMIPELPETEISISGTTEPDSSQQFPGEDPAIGPIPYVRPGSSSEIAQIRPITHPEDGINRPFTGFSLDRRRFNMDGIAEVLLALERIEHDEELSYEQILVLETNLFLGGLSFYDQHRDMRLDIDNMSYEELLALEEKMGSVSTALTEEALSNCLKTSHYMPTSVDAGCMGCEDDDTKCSICQEEYVLGDEVGKLECEHSYHVTCIHQWLRQKNWCPICKASASSS